MQVRIPEQVISAADGISRISGQAAAIQTLIEGNGTTTKRLRRGGTQASESVTVTEQGATGFYDLLFTPTVGALTGEPYLLSYLEPSGVGAMERVNDWHIQVFDSITVTPAGGSLFTTLGNLKEYGNITSANYDAAFAALIGRCTKEIQSRLQRVGFQGTYTEYFDGAGSPQIRPIERPIVSVTSLHESLDQVWDSTTEIAAADYTVDLKAARVEKRAGVPFYGGFQGIRLVYVGGWATVPADVEQACIELVLMKFEAKQNLITSSTSLGDGSQSFLREPRLTDAMYHDIQHHGLQGFV